MIRALASLELIRRTSSPGHFQRSFRETSPFQRDLRGDFVNRLQVCCAEFDCNRPEILFQTVKLSGARNRDDPRLPGKQPRQRNLRGRRILCRSNLSEQVDQGHVGLDRFRRKAGHDGTEVGAIELSVLVYLAGEKAGPQRTEWNEADTKFLDRRQDFRLRAPIKKGILTLDRCDGLDRVRTADRLGSGLRKAEM